MHLKRGEMGILEIYLPTSLTLLVKHMEIELMCRVFECAVTLRGQLYCKMLAST